MPHWHDDNPWADDVAYVRIEDLAACVAGGSRRTEAGEIVPFTVEGVLERWRQCGDKLDAYLLKGALGYQAGVRYGADPSGYLSPTVQDVDLARDLFQAARAEAEITASPTP